MSTEEISCASELSYTDEDLPPKSRRKSKQSPRCNRRISDDVQEDINSLLENVPEIAKIFTVYNKIGSGTFSSVYVARLKEYPDVTDRFALKHIIPTSHPSRIESELKCLQEMGGAHNVMGVQACIRNKDHVVIVMPYFHHDKFQDYIRDVTVDEVRDYMKNLFLALKCVHDHNMIHRDVKPSNFLVNRKKKVYSLVDFGLAQKCITKKEIKTGQQATPAISLNKSQTRSGNSTSDANKRVPLSPKHIKSADNVKNTVGSPRKRKLQTDINEIDDSPRKRQNKDLDKNSKPRDTVLDDSGVSKDLEAGKHAITPQVAFNKGTKKSPRRQLLMKRVGGEGGHHASVIVNSSGKSVYKSIAPSACKCFGQPSVCTICLSRMNQVAPRAGTPGFRSPEVLIKCPDQTTAIDIWSAGVIFLSLLSGRYPFFKADDDMSALAQIISVVGSDEMKLAAKSYGKELIMSPNIPAVDYRVMCLKLRGCYSSGKGKIDSKTNSWQSIPSSVWDLLAKSLHPNPDIRITAAEALLHPFLSGS